MRKGLPKILVTGAAGKGDCPRRGLSPKILVTGGAGFIGSAFVREARKEGFGLCVADKLTYAADLRRLRDAQKGYIFYKIDITDAKSLRRLFEKERPGAIVNFAAETHVDRSILDSSSFIETNIRGIQVLLDAAREHKISRFLHVSTDEVYGDLKNGSFLEADPLRPSSPYAASKAAGDLLIKSYARTYGFPAIIVRPCNNYGPWQYPEKLIPLSILKIFRGESVPLYADGKNVREWLYVQDCARGLLEVLKKGRPGEVYNLGSREEKQNIDVVKMILDNLGASSKLIKFVKDRPGHDIRYSLDCRKVTAETGWKPKVEFADGLKQTVAWCVRHKEWLMTKWKNIAGLYV